MATGEDDVTVDDQEIVGGHATTVASNPWQIGVLSNDGFQFCGGSIIAPSWVITAQHCIFGGNADMKVLAGVTKISLASSGQSRPVNGVFSFPGYTDASNGKDIALLHLETPLDLAGANAKSIGLLTAEQASSGATAAGVSARITGWGSTSSGGNGTDTLQEVVIPLVSNATAQAGYPGTTITSDQLAAGVSGGGVDSCQGDSGGPLTVDVGGTRRLGGTVSWGEGCALPNKPGLYGRVSSFESWISPRIGGNFSAPIDLAAAGSANAFTHRTVTVPAGALSLGVVLRGGSGDADLYVRRNGQPTQTTYDCRPFMSGNYEFCNFDAPAAGTWTVSLFGFSAYANAQLTVSLVTAGGPPPPPPPPPPPAEVCNDSLDNDGDGATDCADTDCATFPACVPVDEEETFTDTNSVGNNQWRHYGSVAVSSGTTLRAFMDRQNRNPDLYVRWSNQPTQSQWTCRPQLAGDELCELTVPSGVTQAFVSIRGRQNGNNSYILTVDHTP